MEIAKSTTPIEFCQPYTDPWGQVFKCLLHTITASFLKKKKGAYWVLSTHPLLKIWYTQLIQATIVQS